MLFCDVGVVVFGSIIITIFDIVSWMVKTTAATLNCMGSSLYGSTGQSAGVHLIWWHVGTRGWYISSFIAEQRVHFVGLSSSVINRRRCGYRSRHGLHYSSQCEIPLGLRTYDS